MYGKLSASGPGRFLLGASYGGHLEASRAVERDVREAFRERAGADELERAVATIDAVRVGRERLGANPGNEEALVRADGHRHHELFGREVRPGLERPVGLQGVRPDIAVLGVRDVHESRSRGLSAEEQG